MQFQGFIVDSEFPPRDGGTARVYKAFKKGDAFALKVYESERILQLSLRETIFRKEVAALQALRHPNIVEFLDAGYSEDLNAYCVALEWLPTNLGQHLAAMDGGGDPPRWWDTFAPRFAVPLLEALTVVHAAGFTHRDLKPSNFLVTADGVPKLADFGIASIIAGDHTVAGFSTPRFAPPEGSKDFRSDLYSMGLSLLDLVSGGLVLGGDHRDQSIEDALYEADLRQDAEQFIRSLVEREPERRFQTAGQAASRLRNLIEARHSVDAPQGLVLEVGIPFSVANKIQGLLDLKSADEARRAVLQDLEGFSGEAVETQQGPAWQIYGSEFTYRAKRDKDPDRYAMVLVDVWTATPVDAESREEAAEFPSARPIELRPEATSDGAEALSVFQRQCQKAAEDRLLRRKERQERILFARWEDILRARDAKCDDDERPIGYSDYLPQGDGSFTFTLTQPAREELLGQERYVEGRNGFWGVVESLDGNVLGLRVRSQRQSPASSGRLRIRQNGTKTAIRRERSALQDVRHRRSVRPDLRDLLVDPRLSRTPESPHFEPIIGQIDEPKRLAVSRALGARDLLAVQGPPGTGKTRFVAEFCAQVAAQGQRVLLTAQSHAAVDNAVGRLTDAGLQVLRIGPPAKVDPVVLRTSHLDSVMGAWAASVAERSGAFLDEWGARKGISDATRSLLSYRNEISAMESRLDNFNRQVDALALLEESLDAALAQADAPVVQLDPELIGRAGVDPEAVGPSQPDPLERLNEIRSVFDEVVQRQANEEERFKTLLAKASQASGSTITSSADLLAAAEQSAGSGEAVKLFERASRLQADWVTRFGSGSDYELLLLGSVDVVAGTCSGVASIRNADELSFDVAVVDEASKATPTEALVPMVKAGRWVLVGDSRQLPPQANGDLLGYLPDRHDYDLEESIFDRLLSDLPEAAVLTLTHQYRMDPEIGELVSQCFYDGELVHRSERVPSSAAREWLGDYAVKWLSTSRLQGRSETRRGTSYVNHLEVEIIAQYLRQLDQLASDRDEAPSVAVIAGYAPQLGVIQRMAAGEEFGAIKVDIASVDAFQGQERDVVIYSVVRSNDHGDIGFLGRPERVNVALSRARDALLIVGDSAHVRSSSGDNPLGRVLSFMEGRPASYAITELEQQ